MLLDLRSQYEVLNDDVNGVVEQTAPVGQQAATGVVEGGVVNVVLPVDFLRGGIAPMRHAPYTRGRVQQTAPSGRVRVRGVVKPPAVTGTVSTVAPLGTAVIHGRQHSARGRCVAPAGRLGGRGTVTPPAVRGVLRARGLTGQCKVVADVRPRPLTQAELDAEVAFLINAA